LQFATSSFLFPFSLFQSGFGIELDGDRGIKDGGLIEKERNEEKKLHTPFFSHFNTKVL